MHQANPACLSSPRLSSLTTLSPLSPLALLAAGAIFLVGISGCASLEPPATQSLVLGEHVAYRVANLSSAAATLASSATVEMPTLVDATSGAILYSNLQLISESPVTPSGASASLETSRLSGALQPSGQFPPRHLASTSPGSATRLPALLIGSAGATQGSPFEQDPGKENLALPQLAAGTMMVAQRGHRVPETVLLSWRQPPMPGQSVYRGVRVGPVRVSLRGQIPADVLARVRNQWRYRLDIEIAIDDVATKTHVRWRLIRITDEAVHEIQRGGQWVI
ncbi:MAG: hypothetical protein WA888_03375 [Burkholderiaceae bacterium]